MHGIRLVQLLGVGALISVAGCGPQDPTPEMKPPSPAARTSKEPRGPCASMASELCKLARASCEDTTRDFLGIGLPDAACAETLALEPKWRDVAYDQAGQAMEKLFDVVTSKEPGLTAENREALARFGSVLAHQYDEIASDGSEDGLPSGKGSTNYLAWPVVVRLNGPTVNVLRRGREGTVSVRPGPELVAILRELAVNPWREDAERDAQLSILADGAAQWESVVAVLRSAKEAGYVVAGIAVRDGKGLRQTNVEPGVPELAGPDDPARPAVLRFTGQAYELQGPAVSRVEELLPYAKRWLQLYPATGTVRIDAEGGTTLQQVVTALEVVANCQVDVWEDRIPDSCVLWRPLVDVGL